MTKSISWILDFTSKLPNKEEKIKCLRQNESVLRDIFFFTYHPGIEWLLPEGTPPYNENKFDNTERVLYAEKRKFYLFVKGGNDNLNQLKREKIFIDILEEVHPDDAKLLLAMKEGKLPYKGLTKKLAEEAYPGIFDE